jgi:anti-sigma regulatory factor (Ser/Thr protein kinase)
MKELSLNILDIVQNSLRAGAVKISIEIKESAMTDIYRIIVTDNGNGIPADILDKVTDPFVTTRTKRKMGLGLPLLKYHAELTGGGLSVESEPGKGTRVVASFSLKHIDRQPLGDIVGVLILLLASNPEIDLTYLHTTDQGEFRFSSEETKAYLEADTLNERDLLNQLGNLISENLKEISASGIEFKKCTRENQ